ncbi:MAG: EVE domain-containing protein [Planctomyces sp.]|jgi:predicted RNA-binding protein with PUA-like domain|nr:EVE domain-containing protein [Planctomyces sp.]HAV31647.1 EVE domain-containing protein [Planctomycetaceae bacterium]HBC63960.1 EVE domain-containing protein [Planctomycetaceae bacterium]
MAQYWLFKSEPDVFSIHDLQQAKGKRTSWEGIRNYQARNFLRDTAQVGDGVLFYHSNADPLAIVGTATIVKPGYPDHFAWEPDHKYFDPASTPDNPVWFMVDIRLTNIFSQPVTRESLQSEPDCSQMLLLKKGSRLSIQPVTETEWRAVHRIAGIPPL